MRMHAQDSKCFSIQPINQNGGMCNVDPNDPSFIQVLVAYDPTSDACQSQQEISGDVPFSFALSYTGTDTEPTSITALDVPTFTSGVSTTVTISYNVALTAIKPGSPATIAYTIARKREARQFIRRQGGATPTSYETPYCGVVTTTPYITATVGATSTAPTSTLTTTVPSPIIATTATVTATPTTTSTICSNVKATVTTTPTKTCTSYVLGPLSLVTKTRTITVVETIIPKKCPKCKSG